MKHFVAVAVAVAVAMLGVAALAGPAGVADAAGVRALSVDAGHVTGRIRSLQGGAGLPRAGAVEGTTQLPDLTAQWRDAGIDFVRTFDWRARLDTSDNPLSLFPRWSADPDDPKSYNFAAADAWVKAVRGVGAELMFTLATEIPTSSKPPADLAKYERVVRRIVQHYNTGWAGGMKHAVRWWEYGDQPDFFRTHFDGTPAQFYETYAGVTRAVKSVDPGLRVGGPNLAFPLNREAPFREGFLRAVRERKLPLDFISWIWFSDTTRDPLDFLRVAADVQGVLDANGLGQTRQVLASFNMTGIANAKPDPLQGAAFLGAAMTYLQDAKVDRAVLFRTDTGYDPYHQFRDPAHVFDEQGQFDARGQVFRLFGRMKQTPQRLSVTGGDDRGFAVLAGRNAAGTLVQVLVTHYAIPGEYLEPTDKEMFEFILPLGPERAKISFRTLKRRAADAADAGEQGFTLLLRNLPWGDRPYTITHYRVDGAQAGEPFGAAPGEGGTAMVSGDLAAPAVELIELRLRSPARAAPAGVAAVSPSP